MTESKEGSVAPQEIWGGGQQSLAVKGIHHYVTIPGIKYLLDCTA